MSQMVEEIDYCGQYMVRTVRSFHILCTNHDVCHYTEPVNAMGEIPDGWESMSRWGIDRVYCPICKRNTQLICVDPDVRMVLDMIGAPYELDYVHRRAYEYSFDQKMRIIKEIKQTIRPPLADVEGSACGSD